MRTVTVPTGLATAAELAVWRLGLAQFAPFLRALDAGRAGPRPGTRPSVPSAGCRPGGRASSAAGRVEALVTAR